MDTRKAYDLWADQYDSNENKTRDLEAYALQAMLAHVHVDRCLEIGCGTGKNSEWLMTRTGQLTSVDLSEEMLAKAKTKIQSERVRFIQADILEEWDFVDETYDLVTFSLVLEHIENLDPIFKKCARTLKEDGLIYIGELHPFKQYSGSKARFETSEGMHTVSCYDHHLSDFMNAGKSNGFDIIDIAEYFDEGDRKNLPRILALLFKKKHS
jgi:ubiquinone/menaquinone biosynthesis C-methylase UbiE